MFQRTIEGELDTLKLYGPTGQLHYVRSGEKRSLMVVDSVGATTLERAMECGELHTAEAFADAFNAFHQDVDNFFDFTLMDNNFRWVVNGFGCECTGSYRDDAVFKASVVLENGAGDEAILIEEEGPFLGQVYANYHDDGLYALEMVDEFVDDNGLDTDDLDDLIEQMPFHENPLADNLGELLKRVDLRPYEDPIEELDDLDKQ